MLFTLEMILKLLPIIAGVIIWYINLDTEPKIDKSPSCATNGTIIDKNVTVDAYSPQYRKYFITIESPNRQTIELETTSSEHKRLSLGDKGIVKYRSNKFISFEQRNDFGPSAVKGNTDIRKEIKVVDKEKLLLKSINAKVKSKFSQLSCDGTNLIYYITFEDETGSEIEFEVGDTYYNILIVGDKGILNYKENRFQSFKRE